MVEETSIKCPCCRLPMTITVFKFDDSVELYSSRLYCDNSTCSAQWSTKYYYANSEQKAKEICLDMASQVYEENENDESAE